MAIDKLDKIGIDRVRDELVQKGLSQEQVAIIGTYLGISGNNEERLTGLKQLLSHNKPGQQGIAELTALCDSPLPTGTATLTLDFTLARGLDYYTGIIFEVRATGVQMGSIGGGGRYDDLTGLFGVPGVPGVGISFGVDRIYDVMEELALFPEQVHEGTQVLFFNLGETESGVAFELMQQLRDRNIRCELFHEPLKFDKQFKYAEKKNIPFAIIMGSREMSDNTCVLRDIRTGEQKTIPVNELLNSTFK
jgi:histidyl-tRNA synthetase